jgi:hypothetical protein
MKRKSRFEWKYFIIAALTIAWLSALALALAPDTAKPCCFANDAYQGTCTVIPGKDETCEAILAYLNNPMSTGKSYCRGTSVRGGWIRVDCKKGTPLSSTKAGAGR